VDASGPTPNKRRLSPACFAGGGFITHRIPGVSLAKPRFTPGYIFAPAPQVASVGLFKSSLLNSFCAELTKKY